MIIDRIATAAVAAMAFVLLFGAMAKLRRPARALDRPLGVVELGACALGLLAPGVVAGPPLALLFAGFAVVHARAARAGTDDDCGCLGERPVAGGPRAIILTGGPALLALGAAIGDPAGLVSVVRAHPSAGALTAVAAIAAAFAWSLAFRVRSAASVGQRWTSASERIVNSSAWFLERRFSRRSALTRVAVVGSALTVAPLRYLLYPVTAMAAVVPGDCGGGLCTDGYTAFCCEINDGLNTCPTGTFPGGWWMCTDYTGRLLCSEEGVRYYVDCNALPGSGFPGGCRCANDDCNERRVACNIFRYGQCNPQIPGVTAVVCRMIVCENPGTIPGLNCNSSVAVDDAVCGHDVPCLTYPDAVEVGLAGGV